MSDVAAIFEAQWLSEGVMPLLRQCDLEYGREFTMMVIDTYGFAVFRLSEDRRREALNDLYARVLAE